MYGLAYSTASKQRQEQDKTRQDKTGCETDVGASRRRMSRDTTWQPHAIGSCLVGWVISDRTALSQPHQIKQGGPDQDQNSPQAASYRGDHVAFAEGAREAWVWARVLSTWDRCRPAILALPKPRMCLF